MHKTILIYFLLTSYIFSNINAIVSILPQQTFVKAIGGDKVDVSLMVQPGNSPHTYEPKPSQMLAVSKADYYFAIGVEFEQIWLPKFSSLNKQMKVIDLTRNVKKHYMTQGHHDCSAHVAHTHPEQSIDPHIWTSPKNVKVIAQNIYDALVKADAKNIDYYKTNLATFLASVEATDMKIKELLTKYSTFMVFHPSWGYFAKDYDLKQLSVEVEGKSPKPRELVHLIKEAKAEKVKAIFTQAEFSDASAKIIANELDIPVIKVSPMAAKWSENLLNIANAIAGKH